MWLIFSKFYILTDFLDAVLNTGAILGFAEVANTVFYATNQDRDKYYGI